MLCPSLWLCVQSPAGWDFGKTQTDFVTLLSPGVLNGTHRWLQRARLWRLILSQTTEGFWEAGPTTAFVVEARTGEETRDLPPTLLSRVLTLFGSAAEAAVGDDSTALDDILQDADKAHARGSVTGVAADLLAPADEPSSPRASTTKRSSMSLALAATIADCPLTCSVRALSVSVPRRLASLRAEDASIAVERVWTTMLCISVLERMNTSWIWGDGCAGLRMCCLADDQWWRGASRTHGSLQERRRVLT